jgi:hypothetical protein
VWHQPYLTFNNSHIFYYNNKIRRGVVDMLSLIYLVGLEFNSQLLQISFFEPDMDEGKTGNKKRQNIKCQATLTALISSRDIYVCIVVKPELGTPECTLTNL